jgi:hypothetical protein
MPQEGNDAHVSRRLEQDAVSGGDQHLQSFGHQILRSGADCESEGLWWCMLKSLQLSEPAVQLRNSILLDTDKRWCWGESRVCGVTSLRDIGFVRKDVLPRN